MGTSITKIEDYARGDTVYEVRISNQDMALVHLDGFDRMILNEPLSKETPLADQLQNLQTLMFRIEQQNRPNKPNEAEVK